MHKKLLSLAVAWGLLASNQWVAQEVWWNSRENQKVAVEAVVDSTRENLVNTVNWSDYISDTIDLYKADFFQKLDDGGRISMNDVSEFIKQHEAEINLLSEKYNEYVEGLSEEEIVDMILEIMEKDERIQKRLHKMANRNDLKQAIASFDYKEILKIFEQEIKGPFEVIAVYSGMFLLLSLLFCWFEISAYRDLLKNRHQLRKESEAIERANNNLKSQNYRLKEQIASLKLEFRKLEWWDN